jgi:hypothetical protein
VRSSVELPAGGLKRPTPRKEAADDRLIRLCAAEDLKLAERSTMSLPNELDAFGVLLAAGV